MSDAVTNSIRVEVLARHSPENSKPLLGEWVFQYTVRITNQGSETVQLIGRHWIITDALGHVAGVKGLGVIGEQPVLQAGRVVTILVMVSVENANGDNARHVSDGC